MLKRFESTDKERRRAVNRQRVREHRQRARRGFASCRVIYNADILDMLIQTGWLRDEASADRGAVGDAISVMLGDAAEKFCK